MAEGMREWTPDEREEFLRLFPKKCARELVTRLRPLAIDYRDEIHKALFSGIQHPFNLHRATGWMKGLHKRKSGLPAETTVDVQVSYMRSKIEWSENDELILVYFGGQHT